MTDWKKIYEKELKTKSKDSEPGTAVTIKSLLSKKRGRPPLLGEAMDKSLLLECVAEVPQLERLLLLALDVG